MVYPANNVQAEVAFDVSTKICRETLKHGFFIHATRCEPLILDESPNSFSQMMRESAMFHPLFRVSLLESPFFDPHGNRLKVGLKYDTCLNMN